MALKTHVILFSHLGSNVNLCKGSSQPQNLGAGMKTGFSSKEIGNVLDRI